MKSEAESFLAAIRAKPEDTQRWLEYADWLENHGRVAEADKIRYMVGNRLGESGMDFCTVCGAHQAIIPTGTFDGSSGVPNTRLICSADPCQHGHEHEWFLDEKQSKNPLKYWSYTCGKCGVKGESEYKYQCIYEIKD